MADDAGAAIVDLETGVLVEEAGDLGLNRLREQGTRPIAKDFRELVVEGSWLNQSDDDRWTRHITPLLEKWRRQAPPRYAAFPIHAVTNFRS